MSRLTSNMFNRETPGLFGLKSEQRRRTWWMSSKAITNPTSRWFDKIGEQLGQGSLDVDDFRRIIAGLEDDELFIVLPEHKPEENIMRPDYLVAFCDYILTKGTVYQVLSLGGDVKLPSPVVLHGLQCSRISRGAAFELLTAWR